MELSVYAYYFDAVKKRQKEATEPEDFETDFIKVVKYIMGLDETDRKLDLKESKKVVYLKEYEYDSSKRTVWMHMISLRYAKIRNVRNVDTLVELEEKKKDKRDGDEEHTYLVIKFKEDMEGICLIGQNSNGISLSKIVIYLDDFIEKYHVEKAKDKIRYRIEKCNIVSEDFLKNLIKAKKIKAVTLTVESKLLNVSEYKQFAKKDDIKEDIDVVLKPTGSGIFENTVREFYKIYQKDAFRRIRIAGEGTSGEKLKFDTEKMKEKLYLIRFTCISFLDCEI